MSYESSGQPERRKAEIATAASHRASRLRQLGLGQRPEPVFDAFAADLARAAQELTGASTAPLSMVNFVTDRQFFAGLFTGTHTPANSAAMAAPAPVEPDRVMTLDQGWCPHVVQRKRALPLDNVNDYPRFSGNLVTIQFGIVSYLGAPVFDKTTGIVLGTVCVVDRETRDWGERGVKLIKASAAQMSDIIAEGARRPH